MRLGYIQRENRNAKINQNVSDVTEIIFRFGRLNFLGAKNNVFGALGFVACAISFATVGVNRKLRNRQNENRRKENFARQKQIQNHQKQQNKK